MSSSQRLTMDKIKGTEGGVDSHLCGLSVAGGLPYFVLLCIFSKYIGI